jgi:hypothetical protein
VVTATMSTRLCAVGLAVALGLAQLLWATHEAKAAEHDSGKVCDLCLSLANVGGALIDAATPIPAQARAILAHRPTRPSPPGVLPQAFHARAPPLLRG